MHHPHRPSFRDRLAWLQRMPTHWRLLIGSQLIFTLFAIRYRHKAVQKQQRRNDEVAAGTS